MISFTDLPMSVVSDVLCNWCDVIILGKVDTAFCSNHDDTRNWLLNILPKQFHTVPETMEFSCKFLEWTFRRMLHLKDLRINSWLLLNGQHDRFFKLNGVESISFEIDTKFRLAMYNKIEVSLNNPTEECKLALFVVDGPIEGEDFEQNGLVNVINRCPKLRKLCINCTVGFNYAHLQHVSPLILSQLVSLELKNEVTNWKKTFGILSLHFSNLTTLVLSGAKMCVESVSKLIARNPKLDRLTIDCPRIKLTNIYNALKNDNLSSITVRRFNRSVYYHENLRSAARLMELIDINALFCFDIRNVVYYAASTNKEDGHTTYHLRFNVDYMAPNKYYCYNALFSTISVVSTICISGRRSWKHVNLGQIIELVIKYYSMTLTSVFLFDSLHTPLITTTIMENLLKSCVYVNHVMLANASQFTSESILKMCESFPQLQVIEFDNLDGITAHTIIGILSSTTNNVTKVTVRHCKHVVASEVHVAVVELNAMPNRTKTVEFLYGARYVIM